MTPEQLRELQTLVRTAMYEQFQSRTLRFGSGARGEAAKEYFEAFPLKKGETELAALRRYQQFSSGGQGAGGGMAALGAAADNEGAPPGGLQLGRSTSYSPGHQAAGIPVQQAPVRQAPAGNELWR